jgi:hypothetical protein
VECAPGVGHVEEILGLIEVGIIGESFAEHSWLVRLGPPKELV